MRLLDSVAGSFSPLAVPSGANPAQVQLAGPSRSAAQIVACPLRFVLGDDLTLASADLAYADGARLVGCLDLLRMPAPQLWIEWTASFGVCRACAAAVPAARFVPEPSAWPLHEGKIRKREFKALRACRPWRRSRCRHSSSGWIP